MQIVYAKEAMPASFSKSLFLAGPSPRPELGGESWRPEALKILSDQGYDGVVFVPESRDAVRDKNYDGQVEWEKQALNFSDAILFWIPRDMKQFPGLTTNAEFGVWSTLDAARVVVGAPPTAPSMNWLFGRAKEEFAPTCTSLADGITACLQKLGAGALRSGGCRGVPLHVYNTPSFQNWYKAQTAAGNRLDDAKVKWVFRIGPKFVLYWAMHVDMYIPSEDRHKTNEVVISRPDVCLTVAWHRPEGAAPEDTVVALIREYRTPATSSDGFAWENPGGSSFKPEKDPYATAAAELKQELGLEFDVARVTKHNARQIAATLSAHKAHVFSVNLTADEVTKLRQLEADNVAFGVAAETERTYPRVRSLKEIRAGGFIDWATMGILFDVMFDCKVM